MVFRFQPTPAGLRTVADELESVPLDVSKKFQSWFERDGFPCPAITFARECGVTIICYDGWPIRGRAEIARQAALQLSALLDCPDYPLRYLRRLLAGERDSVADDLRAVADRMEAKA